MQRDFEVKCKCSLCLGPVYIDEDGSVCPLCRRAKKFMAEAHKLEHRRPQQLPAALRVRRVVM